MRRSPGIALAVLLLAACNDNRPRQFESGGTQLTEAEAAAAREDTAVARVAAMPLIVTSGPPRPITFTVTDTSLAGPDTVHAGTYEIHATNRGRRLHQVRILRIPDAGSYDRLLQIIATRKDLPPDLGPMGGVGPIPPGATGEVIQVLGPGNYAVLCPLPDSARAKSFVGGVIHHLVVIGPPRRYQPPLLATNSEVITSDNQWRLGQAVSTSANRSLLIEGRNRSTVIRQGNQLMMVEHFGGVGHDAVIIRSNDPKDMRAYADWIDGRRDTPPPVVTGLPALFPLMKSYVRVDLRPGAYIIFCPVYHRDPRRGKADRGFVYGEYNQFVVK